MGVDEYIILQTMVKNPTSNHKPTPINAYLSERSILKPKANVVIMTGKHKLKGLINVNGPKYFPNI